MHILLTSLVPFLFYNSGVAGVTFGIEDIYDDKADGTYTTDRSHVQKNNFAQQNGGKKSRSTSKQPDKDFRPEDKKIEKPEGPKKLLGGWEDQGALRIAWDDDF